MPTDVRFDKLDDFRYRGSASSHTTTGYRNIFSRYSIGKLANLLFAQTLQQRMDAEGVPLISTSVHPGTVYTQVARELFPAWFQPVWWLLSTTPAQGAVPSLYLATAQEIKQDPAKFKGLYYDESCKPATPSARARDPKLAQDLWTLSEEAVAKYIAS
jgi:NAD(P)-dependent dehydrogenase (short-subunit alcohol dehydrogenase family)